MKYDLNERTTNFSKQIINFLKKIKSDNLSSIIINQLFRSATSIGANYREANNASSKKDFANKCFICKKEAQETKYWIELLAEIKSNNIEELRVLWQEAHELTLIFNKICNSARNKN